MSVIETDDSEDSSGVGDPRRDTPQIKTAQSRIQIPNACSYSLPYRDAPLTLRSVNFLFDEISDCLSATAQSELQNHHQKITLLFTIFVIPQQYTNFLNL